MQSATSSEAALVQAREHLQAGDTRAAVAILEAQLERQSGWLAGLLMLGALQAELGNYEKALALLERAFIAQPVQPPAAGVLYANVLIDAGHPVRAEALARAALTRNPGNAPVLNALASALAAQDRLDESIEAYREAAAADASYSHARRGEARASWLLARRSPLAASITLLQRSVALDDTNADAWNELGNALANSAQPAASRDAYANALRARPGYHQVASNLLIALHYDPRVDANAMFRSHLDWAGAHAAGIAPMELPRRAGSARLRVGFLSPAFTPGPTASFLAAVVRHLDRERFELFAYNVGAAQGIESHIAAGIGQWRHAAQQDDDTLARQIADDGLDVLVDLAGHTPGGRPLVLARKPARVVIEWLDYFDTTGLEAVDLIVGDPVSTPPDSPQRFTERVVCIDPCRLCYEPPANAPPVAPTPALGRGWVTFGSFNRHSKLAPPVIAAWARILEAVPGSRLLVKNTALGDAATREQFGQVLESHGIAAGRCELRGPTPHAAMLGEYADMDIALDTFPYNGGLTTCEALWMGVPVLALRGEAMISRQSASLLSAAGMADWIAGDPEDYVRRAAAFARDVTALGHARATRRDCLAATPLTDGARFARAFASIIEQAAR